MPSDEIRLVKENCIATIGSVGNSSHQKSTIGKRAEIAGKEEDHASAGSHESVDHLWEAERAEHHSWDIFITLGSIIQGLSNATQI